eukprot:TRINITY_DN4844_c0_g1_i1.p1 TRINITY_DN4844_c0_g1~~TRINITY_DN4844_c0_g1_i1.p1  ORF type:complete len:360 (-),score=53.98 TRINITY_DN4844_c0_g1_i1:89-1168(-)
MTMRSLAVFCCCFLAVALVVVPAIVRVPVVSARDAPARVWKVNLDLPPTQRWPWHEMLPIYNTSVHQALALIGEFIPVELQGPLETLAADLLPMFGEYAGEISSAAAVGNIPVGQVSLLNVIYELEAGCTSIVSALPNGTVLHGRNLDFALAPALRQLTIQVEFYRNNSLLYKGTTYVGYVGLLTGLRPGAFAITADERYTGILIENLLEALFVPGTTAAPFLIRDTLQDVDNFDKAVQVLSTRSLAAPIYLIVSGVGPNEGVVITRDRMWAADIWRLDPASGRWFEVETNYDHWLPAGDDRRKVANAQMTSIGRSGMSLGMMFSKVLSMPPVINNLTTYTTMINAATGYYSTTVRNLP